MQSAGQGVYANGCDRYSFTRLAATVADGEITAGLVFDSYCRPAFRAATKAGKSHAPMPSGETKLSTNSRASFEVVGEAAVSLGSGIDLEPLGFRLNQVFGEFGGYPTCLLMSLLLQLVLIRAMYQFFRG